MADNLLNGFDLFAEEAQKMIAAVTDVAVKKEMLEAMATPLIDEAKRIIESTAKQQSGLLAKHIVMKVSNDGNQVLIGWSAGASFGALLENGYHHIFSRKFIKLAHLRPAMNSQRWPMQREGGKVFYKHIK